MLLEPKFLEKMHSPIIKQYLPGNSSLENPCALCQPFIQVSCSLFEIHNKRTHKHSYKCPELFLKVQLPLSVVQLP